MNFITTAQAAELLRVTPRHITVLIRAGKIKAVKPAGKWLINDKKITSLMGAKNEN